MMPQQPDILLIATSRGLLVCRSTGTAWECRPLLADIAITQITAFDAQTLVVADAAGATQQTFDGGDTWLPGGQIAPLPAAPVVMTQRGPATLAAPRLSRATAYARLGDRAGTLIGAGANGMMLFLSGDDGIHWEPAATPMDAGRITALIPSASTPDVAWAGTERGAILRSGNSGKAWHVVAQLDGAVQALAAARTALADG